jgi:hypothetical protein
MKRRFALGWTLLIAALALALPAATVTAAGGNSYRVIDNYCADNQVVFKAKIIASGASEATKLTIDSWAQERHGGTWQTTWTWNQKVLNFEPNGTRHTLTAKRTYPNFPYKSRIVMRLRAWGYMTQLYSVKLHSVGCLWTPA